MKIYPCVRCNNGIESYDEDGRMVYDTCYHCAGSGSVDSETYFHDQLEAVAFTLAHVQESEYRKFVNSDPDGDGYDLRAAENMMSTYNYFKCQVYDRQYNIINQLLELPKSSQELLINWNNMN